MFNPKEFCTDKNFVYYNSCKEFGIKEDVARLFHRAKLLLEQYTKANSNQITASNFVVGVLIHANRDRRRGLLTAEEFILVMDSVMYY